MSTKQPEQPRLLFAVIFSWVFAISLFSLNIVGAVPYYVDGTPPTVSAVHFVDEDKQDIIDTPEIVTPVAEGDNESTSPQSEKPAPEPIGYLPEKIRIPSLDKDLPISSPLSRDVALMDKELLTSVVRYPGSGALGKDGNIFIFGHSTGYRTVKNQLYKAFNGIQKLEPGAVIELVGSGVVHVYQVTSVTHVDASEALVDLRVVKGQRKLTLSTCDSFGKKSERYVVEAIYLDEYPDIQISQ